MSYIYNPKMQGSGMLACIPQQDQCPYNCKDCFFQFGRSYLEPLKDNLPNMPSLEEANSFNRVVKVNDGNDSSVNHQLVIHRTFHYKQKFYNTSKTKHLDKFPAPVVLTVNSGNMTDWAYIHLTDISKHLMFVRIRTNTWNLPLVHGAIQWYVGKKVPVVLTFMAYHNQNDIPLSHRGNYNYRKRTTNPYWVIQTSSWLSIMARWKKDPLVYSCGQEGLSSLCKHCGNCLREYFATMERIRNDKKGN